MNPVKTADPTRPTTAPSSGSRDRRPWKKKMPFEVVLDQINKVREDVAKKRSELKEAERQLEKLEAARKVLESA